MPPTRPPGTELHLHCIKNQAVLPENISAGLMRKWKSNLWIQQQNPHQTGIRGNTKINTLMGRDGHAECRQGKCLRNREWGIFLFSKVLEMLANNTVIFTFQASNGWLVQLRQEARTRVTMNSVLTLQYKQKNTLTNKQLYLFRQSLQWLHTLHLISSFRWFCHFISGMILSIQILTVRANCEGHMHRHGSQFRKGHLCFGNLHHHGIRKVKHACIKALFPSATPWQHALSLHLEYFKQLGSKEILQKRVLKATRMSLISI